MVGEKLVLVVRHAKAGDPRAQNDRERKLTAPGRAQAQQLPDLLAGFPVCAVRSSPFRRCMETVEPLAAARGLRVEADPALGEGRSLEEILALLWSAEDGTVLCSHGDVIGNLVDELVELGLVSGADARSEKCSTWLLRIRGALIREARYLPAP